MFKLLILEDTSLSREIKKAVSKKDLVSYNFDRFKDGEMFIEYNDPVRGDDVVMVCSICEPVNDNLMKVLIACDALKRSSAKSITLVAPYLGYTRQDRKTKPRQPITAKLVADLLQTAGINRVITCDLHASQIEGFYNIPLDNVPISRIVGNQWFKNLGGDINKDDYVVVSPDSGGVSRARSFALQLCIPRLAVINKYREKANEVSSMQVIGDVKDKKCIIIDDLVDTGGTLIKASQELRNIGAKEVYVLCTHGVFSENAIERLSNCDSINNLFITNTIDKSKLLINDKIQYVDVSKVLIALIKTVSNGGSFHDTIANLMN